MVNVEIWFYFTVNVKNVCRFFLSLCLMRTTDETRQVTLGMTALNEVKCICLALLPLR